MIVYEKLDAEERVVLIILERGIKADNHNIYLVFLYLEMFTITKY